MAPEKTTPDDVDEPLARDIMRTDVVTIGPEATVHELVVQMRERDVSGMPVVDADGRLLGMVTEGDLVVEDADLHAPFALQILGDVVSFGGKKKFEERLRKMVGNLVGEVMTKEVLTVGPQEPVTHAANIMVDKKVSRVPVVDVDGILIGMVTRTDIIRMLEL
jgi:CBS domain-containing protein